MSHAMLAAWNCRRPPRGSCPAQHSTAPYSKHPPCVHGKGKKEYRSFLVIAYDPHMPMMSLSCLPHYGEPDTSTGNGIFQLRRPIEALEYPFPVFDPNRRSEVMYGNENLGMTRSCGNLNRRPCRRILPRIVDVLRQNHCKQSAIRAHGQRRILHRNQNAVPCRLDWMARSEEHTSELQSLRHLVCR